MAWSFCSKDDVLAITDIAESKLKDFWSEIAEAFIRVHMGSKYLGSTTALTEYYDGNNSDTLIIRNPPISSISAVYVDDTAISPDYYLAGVTAIWLLNGMLFPEGRRNIKVVYSSGSTVIDTTVRTAAAIMVVAVANYQGRLGSDTSLIFGSAAQLTESPPNVNIGLVSHLKEIMYGLLQRYKVRAR